MTLARTRMRGRRRDAHACAILPTLWRPAYFDVSRPGASSMGRRRLASALAASTALMPLFMVHPADAGPQGGSVVSGSATISQSGNITTVDQSSGKAIINWQAFSVSKAETVNFNQPSASSVTLNRVTGNETSVIAGAINANGQVFLVNSNGILFTGTSQVNVGGLVASTLDISNDDFLSGNYVFSGSSTHSVVNRGTLTAASGGYVSLMGKSVSNQGVITATLGTVALTSGSKITLNFDGNSLFDVSIDEGVMNALVENKQLIKADGGKVIMTAKAADAVLSAQVNNSGTVQARTMADLTGGTTGYKKGSITLKATGGTAKVSGTLDASAPSGGDGGFIETSGNTVKINESATITTLASSGTTGNWLVDPDGFTIGKYGFSLGLFGELAGFNGGDISASKLSKLLATTNVEISSTDGQGKDGNVNVSAAVSWSAGTTLTLTATNDINVNAAITATGDTAGLTLNAGGDIYVNEAVILSGSHAALSLTYGGDYTIDTASGAAITLSGADASLVINNEAYILIHSMDQLAAIDDATGTASGNYALGNDISAEGTTYDGAVVARLNGTLSGLGHAISGLAIVSSGSTVGLIGTVGSGGTVRDIGLVDLDVTGYATVGGLVGENDGLVHNSYATGAVTSLSAGWAGTGGLVGENYGTITASHAAVTVTSSGNYVGGLVGYNAGGAPGATILASYATGDVSGSSAVGGLIGGGGGIVSNSYASGDVTGYNYVGGLAGLASGTYTNVYATGDVNGTETVGGLIGYANSLTLQSASASGAVTGAGQAVGGLIGMSQYGTLTDVSASGMVTNSGSYTGGVVGQSSGTVISGVSFTGSVSGAWITGGVVGWNSGTVTDAEMTGSVNGTAAVGGIAGLNIGGTLTGLTMSGTVSGTTAVGGVAGANTGVISDATSSGSTSGTSNVGGIAGNNLGTISGASATGAVSGETNAGGLVGANIGVGEVSASTWNSTSTGQANGVGNGAGVGSSVTAVTTPSVPAYETDTVRSAASAAMYSATVGTQASANDPPSATRSKAGTAATSALGGPSVADHIDSSGAPAPATSVRELQEQEARRNRRSAQQVAPSGASKRGYGGAIRTIDVDGQHFDLEKDKGDQPAPPATR